MVPMVTVKANILAWSCRLGGFNRSGESGERSVNLRVGLTSYGESEVEIECGPRLLNTPFVLHVLCGEPLLRNGNRVEGGGGLLHVLPAASVGDEYFPDEVEGRLWLQERDFDTIQAALLRQGTGSADVYLNLTLGHGEQLLFRMPDTYVWDPRKDTYLTVAACDLLVTSPEGW